MQLKTDSPADVGRHAFERAGLGLAPFKCIGEIEKTYQACPGAPIQVGGSCDYCGTGIRYQYIIKDRTGHTFKVGSECVRKTGDAGLIKQFKNLPEVRKRARDKRAAKDETNKAEWAALMADEDTKAKLAARMVASWEPGKLRPWLEYATNSWRCSGASGRDKLVKVAKRILANPE